MAKNLHHKPFRERSIKLKKRYGITQSDYQLMLLDQSGVCAICGTPDSGRVDTIHFCIDHSHTSNKVRGLLCQRCNVVLGKIEDSEEWLKSALLYLSKAKSKTIR